MKARLPLVGQPNQRYLDSLQALIEGKDQRYIGGIVVPIPNPITGKTTFYFEKRPGFEAAQIEDCLGQITEDCGGTAIFFSRSTGRTISVFCESNVFVDCGSAGEIKEDPSDEIVGFHLLGGGTPGEQGASATTNKYIFGTELVVEGTNLAINKSNLAAAGNYTVGIFAGGRTGDDPPTNDSAKYTYSSDVSAAGTSLVRATAKTDIAACGNTTRGIFGGGSTGGIVATTDKYTYSGDTVEAGTNLAYVITGSLAAANDTVGIFAGGQQPFTAALTVKCKYVFAADTCATTTNLIAARQLGAGFAGPNFAYFCAGIGTAGARLSSVDKHNFSSDVATVGTSLLSTRHSCVGTSNPVYGLVGSGSVDLANSLTTNKYIHASDLVVSGTDMIDLFTSSAATSSNPGGLTA